MAGCLSILVSQWRDGPYGVAEQRDFFGAYVCFLGHEQWLAAGPVQAQYRIRLRSNRVLEGPHLPLLEQIIDAYPPEQ